MTTYLIVIGIGDDPNPCNRKIFLDIDADDPMAAQELGLAEARRREPERKKFYVDRCIAPVTPKNPPPDLPDPSKEVLTILRQGYAPEDVARHIEVLFQRARAEGRASGIGLAMDKIKSLKAQETGATSLSGIRDPDAQPHYHAESVLSDLLKALQTVSDRTEVRKQRTLREARAEGYMVAAKLVADKSDLIRGTRGSVKRACSELDMTCRDLEHAAKLAREG